MIGSGRARNIGEIVVTQGELTGISKVRRNVRFQKLLTHGPGTAIQPTFVSMVGVVRWRIWRMRHSCAVDAWKGSEVVIEGVILLEKDHHVANRTLGWH